MNNPVTRGKNATLVQNILIDEMAGDDVTRLMSRVEQLMSELPDPKEQFSARQGLLLGLVQSGKTHALTTAIAMAADNGYKCFIVLTSDNLWLYGQTSRRLKRFLQRLQIEEKQQWDSQLFMLNSLQTDGAGLVLVTTKNATVLRSLITALDDLKWRCDGELPPAVIIDDEADQASLDTQTSKRAKDPSVAPGAISTLIEQIRQRFSRHVLLQVTATPQSLFLQDNSHPYRPDFTILVEPGKGYTGGNTFFSLDISRAETLIRHINQDDLERMLESDQIYVPISLWKAICTFFVGATLKYINHEFQRKKGIPDRSTNDPGYCFLCHISQKMADHTTAFNAIIHCRQILLDSLVSPNSVTSQEVENNLREAYIDLKKTLNTKDTRVPDFDEVLAELRQFIVGTEVQVLNSDQEQKEPIYERRYNILIGGNKLARGVTIPNLIVTYYGRQAKSPNMDTVLQHARMYGYREKTLDVTRVFLTPEVERRFKLINESEQALRSVIINYPAKEYRGIRIGSGIKATRSNVLNPNNIGSYGAGRYYFPKKPIFKQIEVAETTEAIDKILDSLQPQNDAEAIPINHDKAIELIRLTKNDPTGSGLWDTDRIITALETLKTDYDRTVYLVVRRRKRGLNPNENFEIRSVLGGSGGKSEGDITLAKRDFPTLFMYRQPGKGWDNFPFWIPLLRFPDGQYAVMFNFD